MNVSTIFRHYWFLRSLTIPFKLYCYRLEAFLLYYCYSLKSFLYLFFYYY